MSIICGTICILRTNWFWRMARLGRLGRLGLPPSLDGATKYVRAGKNPKTTAIIYQITIISSKSITGTQSTAEIELLIWNMCLSFGQWGGTRIRRLCAFSPAGLFSHFGVILVFSVVLFWSVRATHDVDSAVHYFPRGYLKYPSSFHMSSDFSSSSSRMRIEPITCDIISTINNLTCTCNH